MARQIRPVGAFFRLAAISCRREKKPTSAREKRRRLSLEFSRPKLMAPVDKGEKLRD
jgi:hypothetical protein